MTVVRHWGPLKVQEWVILSQRPCCEKNVEPAGPRAGLSAAWGRRDWGVMGLPGIKSGWFLLDP